MLHSLFRGSVIITNEKTDKTLFYELFIHRRYPGTLSIGSYDITTHKYSMNNAVNPAPPSSMFATWILESLTLSVVSCQLLPDVHINRYGDTSQHSPHNH